MRYVAIRWKLKELLDQEGVTVMALSEAMPGDTKPASRRPQLYTITSPDPAKHPKRVEFDFLNSVLGGLKALKQRPFKLSELLEYAPDEAEAQSDA